MSKHSQNILSHHGDSGWDLAIAEAQRQIFDAEQRIENLRLSVASFEDFKKRGEPWPGTVESDGLEAGNAGEN